jgi:hypothetical protein
MVDAAFAATLWNPFYAKTGIRPEWIVPVLANESGLNPAIVNSLGCIGINQACPWAVPTPAGYGSYTASQQLAGVVLGMYEAIIAKYGKLQSGIRVYQANFLPASLTKATKLTDVLARRPAGGCPGGSANNQYVYCANPGFDPGGKTGVITVGSLGNAVAKSAAQGYVKNVIASAYAVAPAGVGPETDPVYGLDYPSGPSSGPAATSYAGPIAFGLVSLLTIGGVAAYEAGLFDRRV